MKIFIDTDIGRDIDDFVALNLLLNNQKVEVAGISIFPGNQEQVEIVQCLAGIYNRENLNIFVPNKPPPTYPQIITSPHKFFIKKYSNLKENIPLYSLKDISLLSNFDLITLITLAPLTNVVSILENINFKKSFSMGGFIGEKPEKEFNFSSDPESAKIFLQSKNIYKKFLIGKNLTHKKECKYNLEIHKKFRNIDSKCAKIIKEIIEISGNFNKAMHDPLVICTFVEERIAKFKEVYIYEKDAKWNAYPASETGIFIATEVNYNLFWETFLKMAK